MAGTHYLIFTCVLFICLFLVIWVLSFISRGHDWPHMWERRVSMTSNPAWLTSFLQFSFKDSWDSERDPRSTM